MVLCHLSPQRDSLTSLCLLFMSLPSVLGLRVSRLLTIKSIYMQKRVGEKIQFLFLVICRRGNTKVCLWSLMHNLKGCTT